MKKYVVKDTIINLSTLETQVYFSAKDGYTHGKAEWADGYTSIRFALDKIKRELISYGNTKIDDTHCLEGHKWLHHYEIIEVEQ